MIVEEVEIEEVEKKFEPFGIKITVQTEEELFELYHRLNITDFYNYFDRNGHLEKRKMVDIGLEDFYRFIYNKIDIMNLLDKLLGE